MNKSILDIVVIVAALSIGGVLSVLENPLTATFAFLLILGSWELAKFLPRAIGSKQERA